MDINKIILVGRLTKDIELKATPNGVQYAQFDIAVGNGKDKDGNDRPTDFITCVAWNKAAETLSVYLHTGDRVAIEGRYKIDKYQNENGDNRYKHYILVQGFEFLNSKPKDAFVPSEPDGQVVETTQEVDPYESMGTQITVEELDNMPRREITDADLPF